MDEQSQGSGTREKTSALAGDAKPQPLFKKNRSRSRRSQYGTSVRRPHREPPLYYEDNLLPPLPRTSPGAVEKTETQSRAWQESQATGSLSSTLRVFMLLTLASILGLAIGVTLAMLLASGQLDLSVKDVKSVFKALTF